MNVATYVKYPIDPDRYYLNLGNQSLDLLLDLMVVVIQILTHRQRLSCHLRVDN